MSLTYACVDIGSNTTRLLVASCEEGRLRELVSQRAFTRLGKGLRKRGRLSARKVRDTAEVVARQVRVAHELEADEVVVVATAAIRDAENGAELVEAIQGTAGVAVEVLSEAAEARLSFVGATKTLGAPAEGTVAVVDVGGGSSEIAVGTVGRGVSWFASFRVGSGFISDSYLRSDPPSASELHAAREHVAGCFEGLAVPRLEQAVAVGGSAASLRRVVGVELGHGALERSLAVLGSEPSHEIARRFDLDPERARLLPAGVMILDEITMRLGRPLMIGNGGLREGVILELTAGDGMLTSPAEPVGTRGAPPTGYAPAETSG